MIMLHLRVQHQLWYQWVWKRRAGRGDCAEKAWTGTRGERGELPVRHDGEDCRTVIGVRLFLGSRGKEERWRVAANVD